MRFAILLCVGLFLADEPYGSIADLKLNKPEDKVDMPSVPAPKGALVLFDGKSFEGWVKKDGKSAPGWKLLEGGIMQVSRSGDIMTRQEFDGHFKSTSNSVCPTCPKPRARLVATAAFNLQGRYEVQVLDSYGLDSKDDDCAAIYSIAKPLVNACKAPTIWQTYDIEFHAPVFANGKKTEQSDRV